VMNYGNKMNKKGLAWETLGKIILAMVILLVLIGIIYILKDKMYELWEKIVNIFRFGG